jgi:hypothetical protein
VVEIGEAFGVLETAAVVADIFDVVKGEIVIMREFLTAGRGRGSEAERACDLDKPRTAGPDPLGFISIFRFIVNRRFAVADIISCKFSRTVLINAKGSRLISSLLNTPASNSKIPRQRCNFILKYKRRSFYLRHRSGKFVDLFCQLFSPRRTGQLNRRLGKGAKRD